MELTRLLLPEIVLTTGALILFLSAFARSAGARRFAPWFALGTTLTAAVISIVQVPADVAATAITSDGTIRLGALAWFVRPMVLLVGALLLLLNFPEDDEATGNNSTHWGPDAGEYFALLLLSLCGAILVAGSSDLMLLFLGIELASIPTYILVAMSRPVAKAQEAGVKYFFLGAAAAGLMLMGFAFLYGTYGTSDMYEIGRRLGLLAVGGEVGVTATPVWVLLGAVLCVAGFAFKMAAFPLHFYAGDVYEGAGTPVTAFLSFVPKTVGAVALIKLLFMIGGNGFAVGGGEVMTLLAVLAAVTMTVGNVLALVQNGNVKRVLAYSSVAHSGYLLVGIAAAAAGVAGETGQAAVSAVVFYLLAYGLMTVGSFGVLLLVPRRLYLDEDELPATGAERYADLRGVARRRPGLGLAMAVSMFALIGLPLTVGFIGKLALLVPAYEAGLGWLVVVTLVNAAISAGYYLWIVREMWLPDVEEHTDADDATAEEGEIYRGPFPARLAVAVSAVAVLALGIAIPAVRVVLAEAAEAGVIDGGYQVEAAAVEPVDRVAGA